MVRKFVTRHLFAAMLTCSFSLHVGAAWVSYEYGHFEPPRLLPVQSGRASISLRSSPGAAAKSPHSSATDSLIIAPPMETPPPVVEPPVEVPPPVEPPTPAPEPKPVTPAPKPPRQLDLTPYLPDMAKIVQAVSQFVDTAVKNPPAKVEPTPEPPRTPTPEPAKESTPKPAVKTPEPAQPKTADGASNQASQPSQGSLGSQGAAVDSMPGERAINQAPPYPSDALAARQEGRVMLRVSIDATGRVADVRVHASSGVESLDRSAVTTVRGWLFTPARRGGVPVAFEFLKPIDFSIQGR